MYFSLVSPQAISNPNKEDLQEKAWGAVCPLVVRLRNYYEYSQEVGEYITTKRPLLMIFVEKMRV